jgi:hypothetical protein
MLQLFDIYGAEILPASSPKGVQQPMGLGGMIYLIMIIISSCTFWVNFGISEQQEQNGKQIPALCFFTLWPSRGNEAR